MSIIQQKHPNRKNISYDVMMVTGAFLEPDDFYTIGYDYGTYAPFNGIFGHCSFSKTIENKIYKLFIEFIIEIEDNDNDNDRRRT